MTKQLMALSVVVVMLGFFSFSCVEECCNTDSPACPCFDNTGAWQPTGATIQDIAQSTVGTKESCAEVEDGGKPFYQMVLGLSSIDQAKDMACLFDAFPVLSETYKRMWWCSETISYWHKEKGIPYPSGYKNSSWLLDWQLISSGAIRSFYEAEEASSGRGRWINYDEIDYEHPVLGVNIPVPGAYIRIAPFDQATGVWDWDPAHSQMINEMTITRMPEGKITHISFTILEGNSGEEVKNTGNCEDLWEALPNGSGGIGTKKINGFGIDLDSEGNPVFDESKITYELTNEPREPFEEADREIRDPVWEAEFAPMVDAIAKYAIQLKKTAISVSTNAETLKFSKLPDSKGEKWEFPDKFKNIEPRGVEIEINLQDEHPVPLRGIRIAWHTEKLPVGYACSWAGKDKKFQDAQVPFLDISTVHSGDKSMTLVPILFSRASVRAQYIKLSFPPASIKSKAAISDINLIYDWGKDTDDPDFRYKSSGAASTGSFAKKKL